MLSSEELEKIEKINKELDELNIRTNENQSKVTDAFLKYQESFVQIKDMDVMDAFHNFFNWVMSEIVSLRNMEDRLHLTDRTNALFITAILKRLENENNTK
jgi:hypothetical protein